jgi:glycosyltransferase involved in cell wall biosynthesis
MNYKKVETIVIIVDDGSIIKSHIDWVQSTFPMIQLVEKEKNGGIAKCKNTCLRMLKESNVDIYFLLDDDIEIIQSFEDKYINALKEDNVFILDGPSPNDSSTHSCKKDNLYGPCICFTKNILLNCGYFKIPPQKWGHEHSWFTNRVMWCTNQSHYADISSSKYYMRVTNVNSTLDDKEKNSQATENLSIMNNYHIYHSCIE